MTLRETCQKHGWNYHRAWYALATGKVRGPKMVGRVWRLNQRDVETLGSYLTKRKDQSS